MARSSHRSISQSVGSPADALVLHSAAPLLRDAPFAWQQRLQCRWKVVRVSTLYLFVFHPRGVLSRCRYQTSTTLRHPLDSCHRSPTPPREVRLPRLLSQVDPPTTMSSIIVVPQNRPADPKSPTIPEYEDTAMSSRVTTVSSTLNVRSHSGSLVPVESDRGGTNSFTPATDREYALRDAHGRAINNTSQVLRDLPCSPSCC